MPLYVVCPNQCRVRMPINRMGRTVRCPECNSTIRVPVIAETRLKKGGQILCKAELVRPLPNDDLEDSLHEKPARLPVLEISDRPNPKRPQPASPEVAPTKISTPKVAPPNVTPVEDDTSNKKTTIPSLLRKKEIPPPVKRDAIFVSLENTTASNTPSPSITIDETLNRAEPGAPIPDDPNWQERLEQANQDRTVLARFMALCLCFVAVVNMGPAIFYWIHWTQQTEFLPLPRWIYLQIFVGAIHLVYAFFLAQIPDWSALRAVSIAMLIAAFTFGVISTGLLLGGQGSLTRFLGIPFSLTRQATIWCVAMLCLSTLMSYWSGKESSNWQRAERLLKEILSKSTA